jgi:hypothetical protein
VSGEIIRPPEVCTVGLDVRSVLHTLLHVLSPATAV